MSNINNKKLSSYAQQGLDKQQQFDIDTTAKKETKEEKNKELLENIATIQVRNEQLEEELLGLGATEKDIKNLNDNRNIFQKMLNLDDKQGVITGTLELLNRPAEGLQGLLSSSNLNMQPLEAALLGITGEKDFTLQDFGIKVENPLANGLANLAYEVALDPMNFLNMPVKSALEFGKKGVGVATDFLKTFASKTPQGEAILRDTTTLLNKSVDGVKRTFGTWSNDLFKDFNNNVANVNARVKNSVADAQELNMKLANQVNDLAEDTLSNWKGLEQSQRENIIKELELDANFSKQLLNADQTIVQTSKDLFKNKLSTYIFRRIESNATHGRTRMDVYEGLTKSVEDGGRRIDEFEAKTISHVKQGDYYKDISRAMNEALKYSNIEIKKDLSAYIKIEKIKRDIKGVGGYVKDSLGDNVQHIAEKGFTIELTPRGRKIFNKWFNNVKKNKIINKALNTNGLSSSQRFLTELTTQGKTIINLNNADELDTFEQVEEAYKTITGKKLLVMKNEGPNNTVEIRLISSKKQERYVKELDRQLKHYSTRVEDIENSLQPYRELMLENETLKESIENLTESLHSKLINKINDLEKFSEEEEYEMLMYLQESLYKPLQEHANSIASGGYLHISPSVPPSWDTYKVVEKGYRDWIENFRAQQKGSNYIFEHPDKIYKFNFSEEASNSTAGKLWTNIEFDFSKLNNVEQFNLVSYFVERGILSVDDLNSLGVNTYKDLFRLDLHKSEAINKLRKQNITLNPDGGNDFLNLAEWANTPYLWDQELVSDVIAPAIEQILQGNFTSPQTFDLIEKSFVKSTTLEYLTKHKEILDEELETQLGLIKFHKDLLKKNNLKIQKELETKNITQLEMLEEAYTNGTYSPTENTIVANKLKEIMETDPINANDILRTSRDTFLDKSYSLNFKYEKLKNNIRKRLVILKDERENLHKLGVNVENFLTKPLTQKNLKMLNDIKGDIYLSLNNANQYIFSPVKIEGIKSLKLSSEYRATLLQNNIDMLDTTALVDDIASVNNTVAEYDLAIEMNRNPDFKYSRTGLEDLKNKEFASAKNEVISSMLSKWDPKFSNKALDDSLKNFKKEKVKLEKEISKQKEQLANMKKYLKEDKVELPAGKDKKSHIAKLEKDIDNLELKTNENISRLTEIEDKHNKWSSEKNFTAKDTNNEIKSFQDDIVDNVSNDTWTPHDPLSEADLYFKNNDYIKPTRNALEYVKSLTNVNEEVVPIADLMEGFKKLPDEFVKNIDRLANVQMTIQGQIGRLFKDLFGEDMSNWNVAGYLRHLLTPEQAGLAALTKAAEGASSSLGTELFGRNLKKVGMYREYRGGAVSINKSFGTDLFNTNPIQATAIALEIVPSSFTLGGVFDNLFKTNMIKEVNLFSGGGLSKPEVDNLTKYLEKEIEFLDKAKNKNTYQNTNLAKLKKSLSNIDEYKGLLEKQAKINAEYKAVRKQTDVIRKDISELNKKVEASTRKLEQVENLKAYNEVDIVKQEIKEYEFQIKEKQKQIAELEEGVKKVQLDPIDQARHKQLIKEITDESVKVFSKNNKWLEENKILDKEFIWLDENLLKDIKQQFDVLERAGGQEGIEKSWAKPFNDLLKDIKEGKQFSIHKGAYENIKRFSNRSNSSEVGQIWAAMQKYITIPFKKVSLLSTGFHARNILTNYTNAYLAGINPADLHKGMMVARKEFKQFEDIIRAIETKLESGKYRGADEQILMIRELLKENPEKARIWEDFFDMSSKGIIGNNQFSQDMVELMSNVKRAALGQGERVGLKDLSKSFSQVNSKLQKLFAKSMQFSKQNDDWAKISMYRLVRDNPKYKELLEPHLLNGVKLDKATPEDLKKASEFFTKFVLFDYNNLTHAEETYMKALFPFYTWARKNLEFQLKNFARNDKRYIKMSNALEGWRQGVVGDEDNEQDYHENYIPIWNENGKITYIKFDPAFDEVDRMLDGSAIVNSLTPIIKTPLEMITGYDFFTRRQFDTGGVLPGFGLGLNNLLGTLETSFAMVFDDYTPTYEDKKLAGILGKKLLDVISVSKNLFAFGENVRDDGFVSSLGGLFPSVFSTNEIAISQYYNAKDRQRNLQEAIKQYRDNTK